MSAVQEPAWETAPDRQFESEEFLYRPIPMLVPISLGFVFLSLVSALMPELLLVPVVGSLLGLLAHRQIRKSQGNLSGAWLALGSAVLQWVMILGFASMHAYSYATEVPEGYQRVNFSADISKKGFSNQDGVFGIHPDVQKLVDQKVMIKGYMYPEKNVDWQQTFVLCRDSGDCCFGGQPKPSDMIQVRLKGKPVRYRTGLVAVSGVFHAEPSRDGSVYQMDADFFSPAKTWY